MARVGFAHPSSIGLGGGELAAWLEAVGLDDAACLGAASATPAGFRSGSSSVGPCVAEAPFVVACCAAARRVDVCEADACWGEGPDGDLAGACRADAGVAGRCWPVGVWAPPGGGGGAP